ncbi:MAG: DUF3108 domain-containing protein [Acidobacteria bacterium]|uniref:DUF3108 domain-containing protein n=1 Tax=Candidatus Sulfomarinibacter kjeldsenii TaxID=2885994 RepID=A0A8J7C2Y7_9BACT|nr:DUF3108 domain-containing protein [Candidatus Sulfomarinibacter kjeldsenii]
MRLIGRPHAALGLALAVLVLGMTTVVVYRAEPQSSGTAQTLPAFPTEGPFHYKVEYLGVTCGHMTVESRLEEYEGRPAYHVVMTACNTRFFNKIYRVDGQIDSWVDAKTMSTLAYESDITERGRRKIRRYRVDYEKGVVRAEKYGKFKTVPYEGEVALDPLAYIFRGRVLAGGPGSTFDLNILTDHGVTATGTRVGDLKKIKTADGKKKLLRVQPLTADGEMFSRKGEFIYWIDPDVTRHLYRLDFKLPFGRLLAKYTGPADGPVDRRTEAEKADPGPPVEQESEKPN